MCFATKMQRTGGKIERHLSVPFSSGCALRLTSSAVQNRRFDDFQFPSHRDVLCDLSETEEMGPDEFTFSSLLIGMCFATRGYRPDYMK